VIAQPPVGAEHDHTSTGELLARLTAEVSRLVRAELQLIRVEATQAGKRAGRGAGALGTAGLLGWYGGACLLAAAILGLSTVMSPWAAALIVGVAVLIGAALAALIGRALLRRSLPRGLPDEAAENIRADVRTVMEHAKR
jgi:membrane protein